MPYIRKIYADRNSAQVNANVASKPRGSTWEYSVMATLQELQKRLDEKTFDPSELNNDQRAAVDLALESGQLKGYTNVAEVEKERDLGAKLIAREKTKKGRSI